MSHSEVNPTCKLLKIIDFAFDFNRKRELILMFFGDL